MDSKNSKSMLSGLMFIIAYMSISFATNGFKNGGISLIGLILWIIGIVVALVVYFIPSIVARKNNHTQTTAITLLNIFLGWTFIGWVVALIWAVMKEKAPN